MISFRHLCTEGCPAVNSSADSAIPTTKTLKEELESLNNLINSAILCLSSLSFIESNSSMSRRILKSLILLHTHEGDCILSASPIRSVHSVYPNPLNVTLLVLFFVEIEISTPHLSKTSSNIVENESDLEQRLTTSSFPAIFMSLLDAILASELFPTPLSPNNKTC